MDNKTVNKFNNVTCYLTSSTGNITVDAPFAGLPQYDINIAPTGIAPGVYKPVSLIVSETGQIRGINEGIPKDTHITTGSLKLITSPGVITLDLPDGVPLSISSGTLDVVPDTATGGYSIDLQPDAVTSVSSTYPGLVSGTIVDNELTLLPNVGLVTGVTSSDPTAISVTSSQDTNTGGTSVVISPGSSVVTSSSVVASGSTVQLTVAGNSLVLTLPTVGFVDAITSSGSVTGSITNTSVGCSTLQAQLTNNAVNTSTLSLTYNSNSTFTINLAGINSGGTAPYGSSISYDGYGRVTGYTAPPPPPTSNVVHAYISFSVNGGHGVYTYYNAAITQSSGLSITPYSPAVGSDGSNWGANIVVSVYSVALGSVTFTWTSRNNNINNTIGFYVGIFN